MVNVLVAVLAALQCGQTKGHVPATAIGIGGVGGSEQHQAAKRDL